MNMGNTNTLKAIRQAQKTTYHMLLFVCVVHNRHIHTDRRLVVSGLWRVRHGEWLLVSVPFVRDDETVPERDSGDFFNNIVTIVSSFYPRALNP